MSDYHQRVKELQERAAADLGVDLYPGTLIMSDTAHAQFLSAGTTVLYPQPDPDPRDPLNWTRGWKYGIMVNQAIFVVTSNIPGLSLASIAPFLMADFNVSFDRVSLYIGVTVLILGYANIALVPIANIYGRRFTALFCELIVIGALIWTALAKTDGSFMASRAILGVGAAASESLMGMICVDCFFTNERTTFMAIYWAVYFSGVTLGPTIAGSLATRVGWRNFFWICLGLVGFSFILSVALLPETRWQRLSVATDSPVPSSPEKASVEIHEETAAAKEEAPSSADVGSSYLGQGRPSLAQFKAIQPADSNAFAHLWLDIITPFRLLFNPIVAYASFNIGFASNALLAVSVLESPVLGGLYGFSPTNVGNANAAFFVGGVIGMITAGPMGDKVSSVMTRRNNMVREAEFRLLALFPFAILTIIGLIVIAVGVERLWPWEALIFVGFFLTGVTVVAVPAISLTYAVDSYKAVSGEILAIATICKNTVGFSFTYWAPTLFAKQGFSMPIWVMFTFSVFFLLLTFPMYFYGKTFRRWTKDSSLHTMNLG